MAKDKKSDILQVVILTLFMVSAFLVILNLWFAGQRDDAFQNAEAAALDYQRLQIDLKKPILRDALIMERKLMESQGNQDLHTEINNRLSAQLPDIKPSPKLKPKPDRSGKYLVHTYALESGRGRSKVVKPLNMWLGFLERIEAERPDIHVESVTIETDSTELTDADKRMWSCSAQLVLWERKEGT